MPMNIEDKDSYLFHENDTRERCFLCRKNATRLIIVRHIQSMQMIHLCEGCLVHNRSDYLLDNTRPWPGKK